jgi:tRNA (mo5U34)-methyltransferase
MNWYQRACRVVARQGVSGLCGKVIFKLFREPSLRRQQLARETAEMAAARDAYERRTQDFKARALALGHRDAADYYWYHTIDLGNGLVTPGDYDYRAALPLYGFPEDMHGMDVLDVGSATGFFAFEFERRGAKVVSVDLPSITEWDIVSADRDRELRALGHWQQTTSDTETDWRHLDGPFLFCHKQLKSRVRRCYSRVYDLTPHRLGVQQFDLIFVGDVLGHLFAPLKALDVLASLCRGKMILSQDLFPDEEPECAMPLMQYIGGEAADPHDNRSWWVPNTSCLTQILKRVGFRQVDIIGRHCPIIHRRWLRAQRFLIHAHKSVPAVSQAAA